MCSKPAIVPITYPSYCDSFDSVDCHNQRVCVWDSDKCIYFTDCRTYQKQTHEECQAISQRCISNRTNCFELESCLFSQEQYTCQITTSKTQCYWDFSLKICINATKCDQLPQSLKTDSDCRNRISFCTVRQNGGCVQSGEKCEDQLIKEACVWNYYKTIACSWSDGLCMEKICENAPNILTTERACILYKNDSCTTKAFGGCVTRSTCDAATIEAACTRNNLNEDCYWKGTQCVDKICENAPKEYITNYSCAKFKQECITQQGGGCRKNGDCIVANSEEACKNNIKGNECVWTDNGDCLEKNCDNAPSKYQNHEQCQQFMNTCTVNESKNGCVDWSCENITDQSKCLKKADCKRQGPCQIRACAQASKNLNTFESCQQFHFDCTLSNTGAGCVQIPLLCQTIQIEQACRVRQSNIAGIKVKENCGWDGLQCIDYGCRTLNKAITTTLQCNLALSGCVSANPIMQIVQGCMDLPQTCGERLAQDNCEISRIGYPDCTWNSQLTSPSCMIKSCSIAKDTGGFTKFDFTNCNNYLNTCIANNDSSGCMNKPESCSGLAETNCLLKSAILGDCYWLQDYHTCVDKICDNLKGYNNHVDCNSIMGTCTVNQNQNGCQQLQSTCSKYNSSEQCHFTLDMGKCIWTGFVCRNSFCNDAPDSTDYDTNTECEAFPAVSEKCTVINKTGGLGCAIRKSDCSLYTSKQQCFRTLNSPIDDCIWISEKCISKTQLTQFCVKFTTQEQCYGLNNSQGEYCSWYNNHCYGVFDQISGTCSTSFGTQGNCQFYPINSNRQEAKKEQISSTVFNCEEKSGLLYTTNDQKECSPSKLNCQLSWTICQSLDGTCSLNNQSTSCINKYANVIRKVQISQSKNLMVIWIKYTPNICELIVYGFDCVYQKALPNDLSHSDCQKCNPLCTALLDGSACQEQLTLCSNYKNKMACTFSQSGRCIWTGLSCIQINDPKTQCSLVNGQIESQFYRECQKYNIGCSVNANGSACIEQMQKCSDYSASCVNPYTNTCNCNYAGEGQCVLIGTSCVKKTCDTISDITIFNTDSKCSAYLPTCTVARIGGCQAISQCSLYTVQNLCKYNQQGQKCFWNPSQMNCVDLLCQNIENSILFNSHIKCFSVDPILQCTVKANKGQVDQGCQIRMKCNEYTIQEQCHNDAQGQECIWITTTNTCQVKQCTTAPDTIATHNECQSYLINSKCTVAVFINPIGAQYMLKGCQALNDCSTYLVQEQCIINAQAQYCVWIQNRCTLKQCSTAPDSYSTDEDCKQYFNNTCIANYFNKGCIAIPQQCEQVLKQNECVRDKNGNKCFWNDNNTCITRTCQNAPEDIMEESGCQQYLDGCSFNSQKCRTQICEEFSFKTDLECQQIMQSCTSDGITCVTKGLCQDAMTKVGCVTAYDGTPCQWILPGSCTIYIEKNCEDAPIELITDSDCAAYFSTCTVKQGGGCIKKSYCTDITYEDACYSALDGSLCIWNNNQCIKKQYCNELKGLDHAGCKSQSADCTIGADGYCTTIRLCQETYFRQACIEGLDGPCIWIDGYKNKNGSIGACFKYSGCSSFDWKTDAECKMISNLCTTNGTKCIGITTCQNTNTNGGCVTGIDGDCMRQIVKLNPTPLVICKLFTQCTDVLYLSHAECQEASIKCTTDGLTGCIPLAACNSYNQAGCFYNNIGTVKSSTGAITSTGNCKWDRTVEACRDEDCQDLMGATHSQCAYQLSICTSDGQNCLNQDTCYSYVNKKTCTTAIAIDGKCIWEEVSATNTIAICRVWTCSDISNGTSSQFCHNAISSCVSDGKNCISKASCETYTSKTACNSGGSDGICVFTVSTSVDANIENGTCSLMTECSVANDDQAACKAAKDRCRWTAATSTTASSCDAYTCATYQATNGVCSEYVSWDEDSKYYCGIVDGICAAIEIKMLPQEKCFTASGYTYTWNSAQSQCQICSPNNTSNPTNVPIENNETNATNKTNKTDLGYILGIASLLGYLVY